MMVVCCTLGVTVSDLILQPVQKQTQFDKNLLNNLHYEKIYRD